MPTDDSCFLLTHIVNTKHRTSLSSGSRRNELADIKQIRKEVVLTYLTINSCWMFINSIAFVTTCWGYWKENILSMSTVYWGAPPHTEKVPVFITHSPHSLTYRNSSWMSESLSYILKDGVGFQGKRYKRKFRDNTDYGLCEEKWIE